MKRDVKEKITEGLDEAIKGVQNGELKALKTVANAVVKASFRLLLNEEQTRTKHAVAEAAKEADEKARIRKLWVAFFCACAVVAIYVCGELRVGSCKARCTIGEGGVEVCGMLLVWRGYSA